MSGNVNRWRWGDAKPVTSPVEKSAVINLGSMVGLDSTNKLIMLSSITITAGSPTGANSAKLKATQAFLGVSSDRSLATEDSLIRINTSGVHEFKAQAGNYKLGQAVSAAADSTKILTDTVVATNDSNHTIGKCVADFGTNPDTVMIEIFSTKMSK